MYITILGRQPALGVAELERLYDSASVRWFSDQSATVDTPTINLERLGGSQKIGTIVACFSGDWRQASMRLVSHYQKAWASVDHKITVGISAYGFDVSARDVQKTGLILKSKLKNTSPSIRLVPNTEPALNSATSHHNKLGLSANKVELLVIRNRSGGIIIAESIGAQNITAYTKRDQERPKRDAFVGMLPPKLAQIITNLAVGDIPAAKGTVVLDPFCGTGVILQEALLSGYDTYGTDLADKMVSYSDINLDWLRQTHHSNGTWLTEQGDATTMQWNQPISAVACESYLGQPFSAPPSPFKLTEVRGNCNTIISNFLQNIGQQIQPGTPLCVAVPAWKATDGTFTHLPLIRQLADLGYDEIPFKNVTSKDLLYYREDQVVARELLVLVKR